MRVAFITHYRTLYGANRSLLNLVDGLREHDVVPHAVAPGEGDITKALRSRNVPVAILPIQWWVAVREVYRFPLAHPIRGLHKYLRLQTGAFQRLSGNLRVLPKLVKQLKLWNVDVVYTNTSVTPMGAMAARMIQRPHIWHLREFCDIDYGLQYDWGRSTFRYFISRADAVIAISGAIRSYHLRDAASERAYVIYNGVASGAEFDRLYKMVNSHPPERSGGFYTFALIGFIHPAKAQDEAVKALAILKRDFEKVRLLIVGGGRTDHLKALAHDLRVANRIEFWGYLEDPYQAYLACDAVLVCSRNEAMGRVTAEAMSACRPVIGYDQAGTSEIIEHGHTGLLYRGGPEALAGCMKQFIENPEWARELGNNGWRLAREKYSIEAYAEQVYQVLTSVTAGEHPGPATRTVSTKKPGFRDGATQHGSSTEGGGKADQKKPTPWGMSGTPPSAVRSTTYEPRTAEVPGVTRCAVQR